LLARAALPYLREVHGSIINVSSYLRPQAAARWIALRSKQERHRIAHPELGTGTRRGQHAGQCSRPGPGPTESEALAAAGLPEEVVEKIKQNEAEQILLGRRGKPEEIADWIVHLADPASTWLTGQILTVDGGLELT
jgi:NAD(P)-dependent dehydrogenase (short-subunit alcohol dehydrogenase family)